MTFIIVAVVLGVLGHCAIGPRSRPSSVTRFMLATTATSALSAAIIVYFYEVVLAYEIEPPIAALSLPFLLFPFCLAGGCLVQVARSRGWGRRFRTINIVMLTLASAAAWVAWAVTKANSLQYETDWTIECVDSPICQEPGVKDNLHVAIRRGTIIVDLAIHAADVPAHVRWRYGWLGTQTVRSTSLVSDPCVVMTAFETPLWKVGVLMGAYPLIAFVRGPLRRRRRRRKGRCVKFAYDLTGNESGTCPECGTAIGKP